MKTITLTPKKGGRAVIMTPKVKPAMTFTKKSPSAGPKWARYASAKQKSNKA